MKKNLLLMGAALVFSLLLLEGGIRLFLADRLPVKDHRDDMFWTASREFGWTKVPGSTGDFSNGLYSGHVVNDADGNRLNADASTFLADGETIFFIGDSTTASLEVDNDETVPARLEQALRHLGRRVNVLNFGVRGYGTDQSVRKALAFAERYRPSQVVYMYTDNDFIDNNTLKRSYKPYGKGVYLRAVPDGRFAPVNYPVPDYPLNVAAMVVLAPDGAARVHEATLPPKDLDRRRREDALKVALKRHVCLLRAYSFVKDSLRHRWRDRVTATFPRQVDPWAMVQAGTEWSEDFSVAYIDGSVVRRRHRDYFDAQMRHLLGKLRTIDSVRRVHLVWFPSENEMDLVARGASLNDRLFAALRRDGVVDSVVDLNRALMAGPVDIRDLRAPADHHFGAAGNQWICDHILREAAL